MPDTLTTTRTTSTTKANDLATRINDKLDEVKALMIENGLSPDGADAALFAARQGVPVIVGNLADLNRLGAIMVTGTVPTPGGPPDQVTTDTSDAFVDPEPAATEPTGSAANSSNVIFPDNPVAVATAGAVERKVGGRGPGGVPNPADTSTTDAGTPKAAVDTGASSASTTEPAATSSTDLESMTKAQLQAHADAAGIVGVDQASQTKPEMVDAIWAGGG